jgi:hypothetical protein
LAKYKNLKIRRGGGGSPDKMESIPSWMRPYIENVMQETEGAYSSGQLDNVAGRNPLLDAALGSGAQQIAGVTGQGVEDLEAQRQRLTAAAQTGGYDTTALKDAAILEAGAKTAQLGKQYGAQGTLGSARQAVEQGSQNAATAATFASLDRDAAQQGVVNKMNAEGAIGQNIQGAQGAVTSAVQGFQNLGGTARDIEQQQLDAPWQSLQRYASTIFANPNRQSAVAEGGK